MAPDAAALSTPQTHQPTGTRQDADAEDFGFGKGDLAALVVPPKFDSVDAEKKYLKERLALACRIFAQYNLDHHVCVLVLLSLSFPILNPFVPSASSARACTVTVVLYGFGEGAMESVEASGRRSSAGLVAQQVVSSSTSTPS